MAALTTRGFLPYVLRWRILITGSRDPFGFDFSASGDLVGQGEWTFRQSEQQVDVELYWKVSIEKAVLKQLSPVLKPLLVRNHRWAMSCGKRGLQAEVWRRSTL